MQLSLNAGIAALLLYGSASVPLTSASHVIRELEAIKLNHVLEEKNVSLA